jgi:hypothetical protein
MKQRNKNSQPQLFFFFVLFVLEKNIKTKKIQINISDTMKE